MEKSLYFEFVQKYFPQLVTSLVEKINGSVNGLRPYMYNQYLTKKFSADGR